MIEYTGRVKIRPYQEKDIPLKVRWLNDKNINKYLHYDLPIDGIGEKSWFEKTRGDRTREDYVIEHLDKKEYITIGLIGLIHIDKKNKKAEFYISIGETALHGKSIGFEASVLFIEQMFHKYDLNKIYLFTEEANLSAQRLFEKIGFIKEGLLREDLIYSHKSVNRFFYGLLRREFMNSDFSFQV